MDKREEFIKRMESLKDGKNDARVDALVEAFGLCESADGEIEKSVAILEAARGDSSPKEFLVGLADMAERSHNPDAIAGLSFYAEYLGSK
jgi:hypothetical protein